MVKRFRMVAGPNGSGKSTLVKRLIEDYKLPKWFTDALA